MNHLEEDLLAHLQPYITESKVTVINRDQELFDSMRQLYPLNSSGIAWEKIPGHVHVPSVRGASTEDREKSLWDAMALFGDASQLSTRGVCFVFGDSITDKAFRLKWPLFTTLSSWFFELPQVTYVVSEDMKWCFEVAFDGHVFFGAAPARP